MRKDRAIKRFALWKVKPEEDDPRHKQLTTMLNRTAFFFGLPECEHFVLPRVMTFRAALTYFGEQVGIKTSTSDLFLPLIARDRKSDDAVLLLPHITAYIAANDGSIIKRHEIRDRFDEVVTLRPRSLPRSPIEALVHKLTTLVPFTTAAIVALVIAALIIGFTLLCFFLPTQVGEQNGLVIVIGSATLILASMFLVLQSNALVSKNYALISAWLLDNVFRRLLNLSFERLSSITVHDIQLLVADIYRGLERLMVIMPRLIMALIFLLLASILLISESALIGASLVALGVSFVIALLLVRANQQPRINAAIDARALLLTAMDAFERSRFMIFGLSQGERFTRALMRAYERTAQLGHVTSMSDAAMLLWPCALFTMAFYLIGFASASEWLPHRFAAALTLSLMMALAFLYIGLCARGAGFPIKLINSWPRDSARAPIDRISGVSQEVFSARVAPRACANCTRSWLEATRTSSSPFSEA